jgi:hypothetical protein
VRAGGRPQQASGRRRAERQHRVGGGGGGGRGAGPRAPLPPSPHVLPPQRRGRG